MSRYFLAGAFTWAIPKDSKRSGEEKEEKEEEGLEEEYPQIEAEKNEGEVEPEEKRKRR